MEHRTVEEHVSGLRAAAEAFARHAGQADLGAAVPTCPAWTLRSLLAHQGMIHRWARANLLGQEDDPPAWEAEGRQVADPVAWLVEGADALVATIEAVPDDVEAPVFLRDAPAPRLFWARRQCHETTIHAVDALAATLGRVPDPADADAVDRSVALDGIDELLTGFVTRGRSRFADVGPTEFVVRPTDAPRAWTVAVQADGAVVTTRAGEPDGDAVPRGDADAVPDGGGDADGGGDTVPEVRAPARALYLALWNRTPVDVVDDPAQILGSVWQTRARVRWS